MAIATLDLIGDALRDINVIGEVDSVGPEMGAHCLRKLNQLMELWKENDVDFGWYSLPNTNGNAPVPDWARLAVTAALSVVVAPRYGATVSQEQRGVASMAMATVTRKMISEKLENADMSHMPQGSGHFGSRYDIETDL